MVSHIRLARTPEEISAIRIARGQADLILGCDLVTSAGDQMIAALNRQTGRAVINSAEMMTGDFTHDPDFRLPTDLMMERIRKSLPEGRSDFVDATRIARRRLGDTIGANIFVLGVAYQRGYLPLSAEAIEKALEMNAVAVEFNKAAFALGRAWAVDSNAEAVAVPEKARTGPADMSLDELIRHRAKDLVGYQSKAYARRYVRLVEAARAADPGDGFCPGRGALCAQADGLQGRIRGRAALRRGVSWQGCVNASARAPRCDFTWPRRSCRRRMQTGTPSNVNSGAG